MAAYKQTTTWYEDGFGLIRDVFVVSDAYAEVADLEAAIEVGVFEVGSTKHDLDVSAGVLAEDELSFTAHETWAENADDDAAIELVTSARDAANKVYVARFINPHDPVEAGDFEFRGILRPNMSADHVAWEGDEYDDDIDPLRKWKCTAGALDVSHLLERDLKETCKLIPDAWFNAWATDREGYFRRTAGVDSFGHREARFAKLVRFDTLINELLLISAPGDFTVNYLSSDSDLYAYPARFNCYHDDRYGFDARYVEPAEQEYNVFDTDYYRLSLGLASGGYGSLYVSRHLVKPTKDEESFSWWRYKSVGELLFAIAATFGMYPRFEYASPTVINVRFAPRSDIVGDAVYLRDARDASEDFTYTADGERKTYSGAAWQMNREGQYVHYTYDGGFVVPNEGDRLPQEAGDQLPLTISPLICEMYDRPALTEGGVALSTNLARDGRAARLPHNVIFWNATGPTPEAADGWDEYNREALHTGMYITCPGLDESVDGSIGVLGRTVWAPVARVLTKRNGVNASYERLADYTNDLYSLDERAYYETELSITVPYLCGFRDAPDGADDWRNLKLGGELTLNGTTYAVVGIERGVKSETKVRLHARSKYAFTTPDAQELDPIVYDSRPRYSTAPAGRIAVIQPYTAGETIYAGDFVAIESDGRLYRARARHEHYRRVVGVAMSAADVDQVVQVQAAGLVEVASTLAVTGTPFTPGEPLFVRTCNPGETNVSHTPLTATEVSPYGEDAFIEVGVALTTSTMALVTRNEFLFLPQLPD